MASLSVGRFEERDCVTICVDSNVVTMFGFRTLVTVVIPHRRWSSECNEAPYLFMIIIVESYLVTCSC